eukprot:239841-Amphidinium_carterae.1
MSYQGSWHTQQTAPSVIQSCLIWPQLEHGHPCQRQECLVGGVWTTPPPFCAKLQDVIRVKCSPLSRISTEEGLRQGSFASADTPALHAMDLVIWALMLFLADPVEHVLDTLGVLNA